MRLVGIDAKTELHILQLVSTLLHIGNITFGEQKNYASIESDDCRWRTGPVHCSYCSVVRCSPSVPGLLARPGSRSHQGKLGVAAPHKSHVSLLGEAKV